jgi:nucleoside-diphosphate-sugar epimerase
MMLVTGANGFIGNSLCQVLSKLNIPVIGTVRSKNSFLKFQSVNLVSVGNISFDTNWSKVLENCEYIVHCAGKAHEMNDKDKLDNYRATNIEGTKNLAEQAAKAGVKRLVFLSSVKVNGESTDNISNDKNKKIFTHYDIPNPQDAYSISKLEAEKVLWEVSTKTGLEVVVIRLPLVYGCGVKGNLAKLVKIVQSGIPLPLSLVQNQRSMIGMDNLIDLLIRCVDHPNAAGKTFLASDIENLSTPDLIKNLANSMGRRSRLYPVPIFLLKLLGSILGKKKEINRLVGSLKIDSSYTQDVLNWTPPLSVAEGIRRMVQGK